MTWTSLQDVLHLGGHGLFVWGAYGTTLAGLATEAWLVQRRQRRAQAAVGRA